MADDRMTPAQHVDSIARHMQDDDVDAAVDEYCRMLVDAPALQDFALVAGLTPESWLSELDRRHLWEGQETLGDRIWLMSPSTSLAGITVATPLPAGDLSLDDIARIGEEVRSHPLPALLEEGSALTDSVMDLIYAYVMTRGDPSGRLPVPLGPWFPGSDLPTDRDSRLCPRVRDTCRILNMTFRANKSGRTIDVVTDALTGGNGMGSLVGRDLGTATLLAYARTGATDGHGLPIASVGWRHGEGAVRDVCLPDTLASVAVLAGAWSVLDWLYAEDLGMRGTETLMVGYVMGVIDWFEGMSPCQPYERDDDHDLVAFAHEHGDEVCREVFGRRG